MSAHDTLVRAFRALNDEQRANLLWHADAGTPICCGESWGLFVREADGAG